jgi:hypothetical protein
MHYQGTKREERVQMARRGGAKGKGQMVLYFPNGMLRTI